MVNENIAHSYLANVYCHFKFETTLVMYKEPENINIKVYSPINIDSNDEKFFRNTGNVIPQIGYKVLDNVFIDEYGSVYNSEGQVVNCNFLAYKYFDRNIFSKSIQYEDELILIFYKWSVNNYFHWITESLPRVFNMHIKFTT